MREWFLRWILGGVLPFVGVVHDVPIDIDGEPVFQDETTPVVGYARFWTVAWFWQGIMIRRAK